MASPESQLSGISAKTVMIKLQLSSQKLNISSVALPLCISIWASMVILSYFSYSNKDFAENYFLVFIEYAIVYSCFLYEVYFSPKKLTQS